MMKRLLVFGLGTSLIQVIILYVLIFIVYWFAAAITYRSNNDDQSGDYVTLFSAILFPIMVIIQNLIAAVINNVRATYVLMAIAIAVYLVGVIDTISSASFKSGLCLVFGLIVLGIKTKIDERLR